MSSRKTAGRRGTTKKRAQRATSNVFAMFNQDQIQEFKEAFNMIDQNRDGFIDHEDLHDMLASLGKDPTEDYLEGMMGEAPGPINFTMFLTLFGERLQVRPSIYPSSAAGHQSSSTYFRGRILRRLSRMLLAASTRRMWD